MKTINEYDVIESLARRGDVAWEDAVHNLEHGFDLSVHGIGSVDAEDEHRS
jgi:hypothetical protein